MNSVLTPVAENVANLRDNLREEILQLTEDQAYCVLALVQCMSADVDATKLSRLTKAKCKQIIKELRKRQSTADAEKQQYINRSVEHIRNVWIPQITQTKTEN